MVAEWLTILGGICMALFPPLAYSDQYISICRKRNSTGFSTDIPGLLIVANITRIIYWLGERFQIYLLVQSILMIFAQFGILYVCLLYKDPNEMSKRKGKKRRPGNFWQWENFSAYLEFSALLILMHCVMFLFLHKVKFYIELLGFVALGLEATLPIPQLLVNYENKSTAGFRSTVLAGWFLGDLFKTCYYFATADNGIAFKTCAVFQLSVDCLLLVQTFWYRKQTRIDLEELNSKQRFHNNDEEEEQSQGHEGRRQEEDHDSRRRVQSGVAGPESLLNPKLSQNGSIKADRSTETVFELESPDDREGSDDDDDDRNERSSLKK
ncbi:hypothetical protein JCM5350_007294 [Sporobolomyces pararoseus]